MIKQEIRSAARQLRTSRDAFLREYLSLRIATNVHEYLNEIPSLHTILSYMPTATEVDVEHTVELLRTSSPSLQIAVPRTDTTHKVFEAIQIDDETSYTLTSKGIREPSNGKILSPEMIDVVLAPLLSADTQGNRVGYGGGYYDRFLAMLPPTTTIIGLSFEAPVGCITDAAPHDIPLHVLITPWAIHRFSQTE